MFSATMSGSGLFNARRGLSKDIYQTLFARKAGERELLIVGWIATFGVGAAMTALAAAMAARGASIFGTMLTFNTVMSLAYGPPALLGLVVRRTPRASGLASFATGLILGCYGAFFAHWTLVQNVVIIIPASVAVFLAAGLFEGKDAAHVARRDAFFLRLDTPVDVTRELQASPDRTAEVFRFLARTTAAIGLASLALIAYAGPGERATVLVYVGLTLAIAAALAFVRGKPSAAAGKGSIVAVTVIVLGLAPAPAEAGVAAVWAVNDGEKVERDDLAHPAKARNSAWTAGPAPVRAGNGSCVPVDRRGRRQGIAALSASRRAARGRADRTGSHTRGGVDPADARPAIQLFSRQLHERDGADPRRLGVAPGSPAARRTSGAGSPFSSFRNARRAGGFP
jgi:hypothetical protein